MSDNLDRVMNDLAKVLDEFCAKNRRVERKPLPSETPDWKSYVYSWERDR